MRRIIDYLNEPTTPTEFGVGIVLVAWAPFLTIASVALYIWWTT